jgi:hypothetical protein
MSILKSSIWASAHPLLSRPSVVVRVGRAIDLNQQCTGD